MRFFVMEYNRRTEEAHWTEFGVIGDALALLREKEAKKVAEMEVVLLMGRSIGDLKITHGRYFMGPVEMAQRWQERVAADGLLSAS